MRRKTFGLLIPLLALICVAALVAVQLTSDSVLAKFLVIFSSDGNLEDIPRARRLFSGLLLFLSVSLAWLWVALFSKIAIPVNQFAYRRVNVAAGFSFAIATIAIAGYLLHRAGFSQPLIYRKEGLLEVLSAVLFIVATLQFGRIFTTTLRDHSDPAFPWTATFSFLAAGACFFVGMEEISWGQHYLRFDTPDWIESRNYQSEFTVHNFLPQNTLNFMTNLVFWLLFACVAFLNLSNGLTSRPLWQTIRPDSNLLGLSLLIAVTASTMHADPAEFLLSLAAVYYALLLSHRLAHHKAAVTGSA